MIKLTMIKSKANQRHKGHGTLLLKTPKSFHLQYNIKKFNTTNLEFQTNPKINVPKRV